MRPQSRWRPVRCGRAAGASPRLAPWPWRPHPQSPAPVRQIANAIAGWVDRLGAVWVEGQVAQVSRRPGVNTVFMTLRDAVADISVPVTCSRTLFDGLNPPLVEGASVVVHAKPSYYANRGTLSLYAREIRMVGPRRAARPARAAPPAARRRGAVRRRAQAAAAVPARPRRAGHRPELGRRARRARERPPPLAGGRLRGRVRRDAGPARRRRGDRGAGAARPRPATST